MDQLERKVTIKSISFSGEKGEDGSGHRLGGLEQMEGAQRSTFPPLPFCYSPGRGYMGVTKIIPCAAFKSVAPPLSSSGV